MNKQSTGKEYDKNRDMQPQSKYHIKEIEGINSKDNVINLETSDRYYSKNPSMTNSEI